MTARLAFKARARDINAASGEEFLLRGEVQRGEGERRRPVPVPPNNFTGESEGAAQKGRPAWETSPSATSRRMMVLETTSPRYRPPGEQSRRLNPCLAPKFGEELHVARLLMPETEILANQDGFYAQDRGQEFARRIQRGGESPREEIESEREDYNSFQAERGLNQSMRCAVGR